MQGLSYFHRRMQEVKEDLLKMAGRAEEAVHAATQALVQRDRKLAEAVIQGDRRIDLMQNEIEERCISLLATQQPVAVDLRFLSAVMKITTFLERMGDQAVNLAQRVEVLAEMSPGETPATLLEMADISREMAKSCLDAFVAEDVAKAEAVLARDDELDQRCRSFLEEMIAWMTEERRVIRRGVEYVLASRHLERIGDEATNVAEEVVYLVEGRIIRHGGKPEVSVGPL
ncbi:MAG: phosphate signaling complex protein PhoU [Proteobacteria bacterium]|nr:phosphate signaling complex protein PhoU [Pseudomonadota bacterium]MBU2468157.1 phosphate signaling complex protein PhoU [Pseudomonadota bacterium]MBU2516968.1 phosphate signaling complex protein PhoU [Pseudomonadota bacterium]